MEDALKIAAIAGPIYLIIGLSVLLYAKPWQKLIGGWQKDHFGLFPIAILQLVLGLIIIRTYNIWEWNPWLLVTIIGWALFLKGTIYLLAPGSLIKSMLKLKDNDVLLYVGGLFAAVIGVVLSYYSYFY